MDISVLDSRRFSWRGVLCEYFVSKVDQIFIVHEGIYPLPSTTLDLREKLRASAVEFADLIPEHVSKVHFPQVAGVAAQKKIHYFGLPSNADTEEMVFALALGFALKSDDFFRESILPPPDEPQYSVVIHTEPFPEDYLEFELPGICQKGISKPLQWGPMYVRLLVKTANRLAKWFGFPQKRLRGSTTDYDLFKWIITRPQADPSHGDPWNIALTEFRSVVMKMAEGYRKKKFSAIKASGLVVRELWNSCIKYMQRHAGYTKDDALTIALRLDEDISQESANIQQEVGLRLELDPIQLYIAENMTLAATVIHGRLAEQGHQISYKKVQRLKREIDDVYEQAERDMYELSLTFRSEIDNILKLHKDEKLGKPIPIAEEELSENDERKIRHLVREATRAAETEEI